jgi:hypothetical protein
MTKDVQFFRSVVRRRLLATLLVAAACAQFSALAAAQTSTGGIRGVVRDQTGAVLAGVTAEATSPTLIGGPSVQVTNREGSYLFDRLRIGVYKFTFTLQGFRTVIEDGVRVEVGRTIDLNVTMPMSQVTETVTVSAAAPVVDSVHAGTSTNFQQQLLSEIPSARISWFNTVGFAPAVRADLENFGGATFIMYGSTADQDSFQFEGIDYNGPSGTYMWDRPNPDSMGEVQLKSIGASAEASGFQGGVINVILKSATNDWKGRANYFFINNTLTGNNTPGQQYPFAIGYFSDFTFQFGGPIRKDRFWLNGFLERYDNKQVQVGVPLATGPVTRRTKITFKGNVKLSARDTLDFAYQDNIHVVAPQTSVLRPVETTTGDQGDNPTPVVYWTRVVSNKTVFEVRGGGIFCFNEDRPPWSGDTVTPGHYDIGTGQYSINTASVNSERFRNWSINATLTHYAESFIKGSHDFKVGVQLSPSTVGLAATAWMSNKFYYDLKGKPYYELVRDPSVQVGEIKRAGVFVQDNWTVQNRVTLNLGARFDHDTAGVPTGDLYDAKSQKIGSVPGLAGDVLRFNNVSPRLGLSVKLDSTGKTVAKVSFGRYYGRLSTPMFSNIAPGITASRYFYYDAATGQYDIPYYTVDPKVNYAIDPNLTNQYTDQVFIGVERQLLPGLGIDLQFVSKKEHDFIRVKDVRGVYATQPVVDSFNGAVQTLTIYNLASPSSQSLFETVNRNDFQQDYKSVVVQVNKRMSKYWQVLGSYQWERVLGDGTGSVSLGSQAFSNTGPSGFGRDPNDLTNAYGPLYSSVTHTLKANAAIKLPAGVNLGVQEDFETGRPYARIITVTGLKQGSRSVIAQARGSYRLPATNELQVRFGKDFGKENGRRLRLSVDVYNLFNVDSPITVRNNSSQGASVFGQTLSVFTPRRAQLGIRYEF